MKYYTATWLFTAAALLRGAFAQFSPDDAQHRLLGADESKASNPGGAQLPRAGEFTKLEQHPAVCDAGSKQWAGKVGISDESSLFYWFFESRNDPANDPVILYLDGGPGMTSMVSLFGGFGPCLVDNALHNVTAQNPFSWTNFANVVFIDQPTGVGFSTNLGPDSGAPDPLAKVASDMSTFLDIFFTRVFPQVGQNDLHLAGNSFAGHFVPGIVAEISRRQREHVPGTPAKAFDSIILYNGVLFYAATFDGGMYDHFCRPDTSAPGHLNETACRTIAERLPECERLQAKCIATYDVDVCTASSEVCAATHAEWLQGETGGIDLDDDRRVCEDVFNCGYTSRAFIDYLNVPAVQRAIFGQDAHVGRFIQFNESVSITWATTGASFLPTTRQMSYILDETDVVVLMVNGNNDCLVDTTSQTRLMDNLPWKRQARFRSAKFVDWKWPSRVGGETSTGTCKGADKLSFFTVDESGHMPAKDQKESMSDLMKLWVGGDRKEEFCSEFGV